MRLHLVILTLFSVASPLVAFQEAPFVEVTTGPFVGDMASSFGLDAADIDNDGSPDLFVANNGTNDLYLNDGDGGFTAVAVDRVVLDGGFSWDGVFGDIDNDGDADLFVSNRNGADNFLYLNRGGLQGGAIGTFQSVTTGNIVNDGGDSYRARWADGDGDGDLDLMIANQATNALWVNNGGNQGGTIGTFAKLAFGAVATDNVPSRDVAWGDLTGDGAPDLFVANSGGNNNGLYVNAGMFLFNKITVGDAVTDGGDSWGCDLIDGDADGDLDIVVANFGADNAYYVNQGGEQAGVEGTFLEMVGDPLVSSGGASFGLATGDVDCNGLPDVAIANFGQDNDLFLNTGGSFVEVVSGDPVGDAGASYTGLFADVDMDGGSDLLFVNSAVNFAYTNTSDGRFARETADPLASDGLKGFVAAIADIDGDDDQDVFVGRASIDANSIYVNQGGMQAGTEGTFVEDFGSALAANTGGTWDAAFADIDGDGDADLAVANRLALNSLYVNQGGAQAGTEGDFVQRLTGAFVESSGNSRAVRFADADNDGDQDVVVINSNNEGNFLFFNQGNAQAGVEGEFASVVSPITTTLGDFYGAAWGDIDGDGDIDLFAVDRGDDNQLFVNQGGLQAGAVGVFALASPVRITSDGGESYDCAFGDKDNDGDLDLYVANRDEANFLYTNTGGLQSGVEGVFVAVTTGEAVADAFDSRFAGWSDIDVDGDMDLVVANAGAPTDVFCNATVVPQGSGSAGVLVRQQTGWLATQARDSRMVAFGDLDSDDDDDVIVTNDVDDDELFFNLTDPEAFDPWMDVGVGLAGSNGVPHMNGTGTLIGGESFGVNVIDAASNSSLSLVVGLNNISAPFKGGTLVPSPDILLPGLPTDGIGFWFLTSTWPTGIPSATTLYFQAWIVDGAAVAGLSSTNGLAGTTP